jgi:CLIP-associating protein 1/2
MHAENGLQFRAFVPALMELLEDADGMVRDGARNAVIELFQYAKTVYLPDAEHC